MSDKLEEWEAPWRECVADLLRALELALKDLEAHEWDVINAAIAKATEQLKRTGDTHHDGHSSTE